VPTKWPPQPQLRPGRQRETTRAYGRLQWPCGGNGKVVALRPEPVALLRARKGRACAERSRASPRGNRQGQGLRTTATSPNSNAQGTPFVTTTTQTSSRNSNSDTGQQTTTNNGGHPEIARTRESSTRQGSLQRVSSSRGRGGNNDSITPPRWPGPGCAERGGPTGPRTTTAAPAASAEAWALESRPHPQRRRSGHVPRHGGVDARRGPDRHLLHRRGRNAREPRYRSERARRHRRAARA
jgi:hypothetical protein